MSENQPRDPITQLAIAWTEAGQRAPTPVVKGEAACMLPGCGLEGWVQVKTHYGPIVICFGHFQDVRDIVQEQSQVRKRSPYAQPPA